MLTLEALCSLRRLPLILLFVFGLVASASAQAVKSFDPQTHLTGYHEAFLGEFGDLYNFTPFQDAIGRRFDVVEMERLRKRWDEERQRVAERIAKIQADPRETYLHALERRLRRSKFFQQTELTRIDTFAPYYIFVERPFKRQDEFELRFVHLVAPWVQKLGELFRATYTVPENLTQNPKSPCFAVVVLASKGRYSDYSEAVKNPGLYWSEAHYDPELRLAITYRGESSYAKAAESIRRALLHEFVHALQHAHAQLDLPQEPWLVEGMAEYLSYFAGDQPTALEERAADKDAVEFLTPLTSPGVSEMLLPGIAELASCRNYGEVVARSRKKLRERNYVMPDTFILGVHYAHASSVCTMHMYPRCALCTCRVVVALPAPRRGRQVRLADAPLRRAGTRGQERPARVDRGLRGPRSRAARRRVQALCAGALPWLLPGPQAGGFTCAGAFADHRGLGAGRRIRSRRARARPLHGRGPTRVCGRHRAQGRNAGCAGVAERVLASAPGAPLRARVEVELGRLDAYLALRERFVLGLIQSKVKIDLVVPEGRLLAVVEGVEGAVLRLGSNRLKLATLDLERLDSTELGDLMRNKKYGALPHWAMAYPYLLAAQTSGKLRLFDASADSRRLEADATGDYPAWISRGEALQTLDELSKGGSTLDATNAEALLTDVQEFYRRQYVPDVLEPKRDALRSLARAALQRKFEAVGLSQVLTGAVRDLGNERVEISYDFVDAREADDFTPVEPHYALQMRDRSALPRLESKFTVAGGALQTMGLACSRHKLALEAPSIEYTVSFDEPWSNDPLLFVVGLCDDGYGSFLSCTSLGNLMLLDKSSGEVTANHSPRREMIQGQMYSIQLANDGKVCRAFVDGVEVARVAILARPSGYTLISNGMNNTLKFHSLKIQGKLTATSRNALQAKWIEEEFTRRGFSGT